MGDCLFCGIVAGDVAAAGRARRPSTWSGSSTSARSSRATSCWSRASTWSPCRTYRRELRDPFLEAGQRLATAMVAGLGAQGSFVAMNNTVSQSVPHLHLHVVPRTKGDGLRGFFWPRTKYADAEEQSRTATGSAPP